MALSDYIPNIFGQAAPSYLPGLLGAEETQNLQNRANVQGLLGAGLALAQGMSRTGPRRSAAENILGSIAGGFGAAGGAYDQGIKNYVTQQQIAQTQLAQIQAANKLRSIADAKRLYPDLAPLADIDPGKFAEEVALRQRMASFGGQKGLETPDSLRAQAQSAYTMGPQFKPFADSLIEKANRLEVESRLRPQTPAAGAQQPTPEVPAEAAPGSLPGVTVAEDNRLVNLRQQLINQNASIFGISTKEARDQRKANEESIKSIDDQLKQLSASSFDWAKIEKDVPTNFKAQVDALKRLSEGGFLPLEQIRIGVQEIYKQAQESAKGMRLEGLTGTYAQMKYKTMDQTKLDSDQLADVIRFQNAPDAAKQAELARENQRLQFETGRGSVVPAGRDQFLSVPPAASNVPTQVPVQQATQVAPQPVPRQTATQAVTQVATQAAPQAQVTQTVAPENAPAETKNLYSYNKNALINKPDKDYSPAKKQALREKQAPLQSAVTYSITSIKDARDAAQSLKNNPQYIDALTGRFSPLLSGTIGGVVVDQNAKTANDLLQNILTRSFVKEIQAMRDASPTGGAVGSVTEKEMDALSKISAALSVGMNKDEFIKQLDNYLAISNRSLKNIPIEYSKTFGYNGEFDEILTTPGVSTTQTSGKTPVQLELERRKGKK
jgi:hypothetical protein